PAQANAIAQSADSFHADSLECEPAVARAEFRERRAEAIELSACESSFVCIKERFGFIFTLECFEKELPYVLDWAFTVRFMENRVIEIVIVPDLLDRRGKRVEELSRRPIFHDPIGAGRQDQGRRYDWAGIRKQPRR